MCDFVISFWFSSRWLLDFMMQQKSQKPKYDNKIYSLSHTHSDTLVRCFSKFWCVKSQQNAIFCTRFRHSFIHPPPNRHLLLQFYAIRTQWIKVIRSFHFGCRRAHACVSCRFAEFIHFYLYFHFGNRVMCLGICVWPNEGLHQHSKRRWHEI